MGARVFSDAGRMVGMRPGRITDQSSSVGMRSQNSFNQNYRIEVLYDNTAGIAVPNLLATEAWVDATGFYRGGVNLGPTVQNLGLASVSLQAVSGVPRDWVDKVATDASLVTRLSGLWEDLDTTLATGDVWRPDGAVYSIFRLVFTPGNAGQVVITSL